MSEEVKSDCSQPVPSHIRVLEETDQRKVLEILPGGQRAAVFRNFVVVITIMALGATVLLGIGTLRQGFPLIVLIGPALLWCAVGGERQTGLFFPGCVPD